MMKHLLLMLPVAGVFGCGKTRTRTSFGTVDSLRYRIARKPAELELYVILSESEESP